MKKSQIFAIYNKAKGYAMRNPKLDEKVVNRALGLAQRADNGASSLRKYNTDIRSCNCKYQQFNPERICKHRVLAMFKQRIEPKSRDVEMQFYIATNGDILVAEQVDYGRYQIVVFSDIQSLNEYALGDHGRLTHPKYAKGTRLTPDIDMRD